MSLLRLTYEPAVTCRRALSRRTPDSTSAVLPSTLSLNGSQNCPRSPGPKTLCTALQGISEVGATQTSCRSSHRWSWATVGTLQHGSGGPWTRPRVSRRTLPRWLGQFGGVSAQSGHSARAQCGHSARAVRAQRPFGSTPPPTCRSPPQGRQSPITPWGMVTKRRSPTPPLGDRTTTVHAHLQAQKLQHKTKEFSIGCVQRAANVQRPTP